MEVHQGDLHVAGKEKGIVQFKQNLSKDVSLKWSSMITQGMRHSHLKCERLVLREGTRDLGEKRASALFGTLYMEDCNGSTTCSAITTTRSIEEQANADYVNEAETIIDRRGVGLSRYPRYTRCGLSFVVEELSDGLAKPMASDMARSKKLARYIEGTMDLAAWLPKPEDIWKIPAFSDSDWANDGITRKSVGAGGIKAGANVVMHYCRSQATPARSSAEALYYAMVTVASEALHTVEVVKFLSGVEPKITIFSDASGARSIAARQGVGRLRHLECGTLWLQDVFKKRDVSIQKVGTQQILADLLTTCIRGLQPGG